MCAQKENYIKLLGELNRLEEEVKELQLISTSKEQEKKEIQIKYDSINKEIEAKEKEKEYMLNKRKIITIYRILKILTLAIAGYSVFFLVNKYIKLPLGLEGTKYILTTILEVIGITSISIFSLSKIEKTTLKKYTEKIVNSTKYKKILEDIKTKKAERKEIIKRENILFEEYLQLTLNCSAKNAMIKIKKAEIEMLKNGIFKENVVNIIQEDNNTKPYIRMKTKTENSRNN